MTFDHELRELIREAAKLAIRDEVPAILREQLKQLVDQRPQPAVDGEQRLSTAGAAGYAGVSTATIREWASSGRLRSQRAGRVLRFRKSDLDAFLSRAASRHHRQPTPSASQHRHARAIASGSPAQGDQAPAVHRVASPTVAFALRPNGYPIERIDDARISPLAAGGLQMSG